jgi:hypothetical protein
MRWIVLHPDYQDDAVATIAINEVGFGGLQTTICFATLENRGQSFPKSLTPGGGSGCRP